MHIQNDLPDQAVKVLIIDLSKRYGGASTRAIFLAKNLRPWPVAIAGIEDSPVVRLARENSIPVRILARNRADPRIPFRLAKLIRQENFQVIDTQNIQSKFWASLSALLVKVAFVSTLNSSYESEQGGSLKGKIYQSIDLWTNWRTDLYVAVSETIRKNLLEAGIQARLIELIRNAVEADRSLSLENRQTTRSRIGVPQDAILYVLVGRLVWAKGYDDFITAFSRAVDQIPNLHAVIAGSGELYADLSEQIKQAGLEKRVILLGFCESRTVFDILSAGDIYVMPSRSEGIPFALLEAAALGLPIVASDCGGIPEVVTNGKDALLVPVGDRAALSSALIELGTNKKLAEKLGLQAREKIKHDFAPAVHVEAMRRAYTNALMHRVSLN
jgi:glycosyltransferase involved in cell wall biosynthesis